MEKWNEIIGQRKLHNEEFAKYDLNDEGKEN
jgi:hypothetical protein